jgi:hypothetical protein
MDGTTVFTILLVIVLVFGAIYLMDPTFFGILGPKMSDMPVMPEMPAMPSASGSEGQTPEEGFESNRNPGSLDDIGKALKEGFQNNESAGGMVADATNANPNIAPAGSADVTGYEGPAQFGSAEAPAGCYPRDQLTPSELLPKDPNSVWAQQNPMGTGSLKGKNFLSAGALIGVNTVGQSMRNANLQLRSEPPNPQAPVSIFNVPTIEPDINRRPLEIG